MARASAHHVDRVWAVIGGRPAPLADGIVRQSWLRSANAHGIDPGSRSSPRILTASELRASQEISAQLIDAAGAELDHLYKIVRPTRYVILLCDKDGLVIAHRGEEGEAAEYRRWGTWLGGIWSEEAEGTNGIGTCVAEQRPVTVHRSQHFRARHISLSCSGSPIHGPGGDLIGVLDVSSIDPELSEHSHALTGALTIATARAIEERLFRMEFRRQWIIAAAPSEEPGSAILIAVDRDHVITGADRNARRALSRAGRTFEAGGGLSAVFEPDDALFRHPDRGDNLVDLRPRGTGGSWPAIVTPPEPASARWSQSGGDDLHLRPRLDALASAQQRPKPASARGGLPPATLSRIKDYVNSHLDQTIDLELLAATAELSLYHFARTFKQSEGTTPHMFVLERRLAKARALLTGSDLPLSEIAFAAGFADQSHLARRFRQMMGVSPGQFRKLNG